MIADMEVGDTVLTTSGFYGVVIDISETDVIVEFGNNKNCRIPMQKAAIMQVEKPGAQEKRILKKMRVCTDQGQALFYIFRKNKNTERTLFFADKSLNFI